MYVEFKARLNKFSLRWNLPLECYSCDKEKEIKSPGLGDGNSLNSRPSTNIGVSLMKGGQCWQTTFYRSTLLKRQKFSISKKADLFNHCPDLKPPCKKHHNCKHIH